MPTTWLERITKQARGRGTPALGHQFAFILETDGNIWHDIVRFRRRDES
jgi:hypothetical protein